ncbi:hypothetical protein AQUCO_06800072v1 [Aquilegia coerulea]|uniref:Uncharacterized protein n=1 Tax=Aquilegia coerulea TaxID=218851 RepID=A0A2G5CBK8_AQUCA|nr:hypothetical protein AQUCO_06800072v1 [Aquilegia coerulea]
MLQVFTVNLHPCPCGHSDSQCCCAAIEFLITENGLVAHTPYDPNYSIGGQSSHPHAESITAHFWPLSY